MERANQLVTSGRAKFVEGDGTERAQVVSNQHAQGGRQRGEQVDLRDALLVIEFPASSPNLAGHRQRVNRIFHPLLRRSLWQFEAQVLARSQPKQRKRFRNRALGQARDGQLDHTHTRIALAVWRGDTTQRRGSAWLLRGTPRPVTPFEEQGEMCAFGKGKAQSESNRQ